MTATRAARRRAGQGDRGVALIEFALVVPVLFAIVFGIIDFGGAYNDWISVRQGGREAARVAVTGRFGSVVHTSPTCTLGAITSTGPAANDSVRKVMCLAKDRVGLDPKDDIRVMVAVNDPVDPAAPAPPLRGSIGVCVMYPLSSLTGWWSLALDGRTVRTEVQMRTEQTVAEAGGTSGSLSQGQTYVEYNEPALPGQDWAFCQAENT